jgi:hypothetical protein
VKDSERQFAKLCVEWLAAGYTPRDVINSDDCKINHKQCWFYLQKWSTRGWYDYGVTIDLGWLTAEGKKALTDQPPTP